jgi:Domain of unknown function (DUF1772)
MYHYLTEALLWLLVLNLGVAFGAGLYEKRIILPLWFEEAAGGGLRVNAEAMRSMDTGRRFWGMVTTAPLTLLTLANLALVWGSQGARHPWWLAAVLITLVERVGTFSFFIPTAIRLMRVEGNPSERSGAIASRWVALNDLRALLTLAGWLAALRALSLPG